jgi:hypothetical protein
MTDETITRASQIVADIQQKIAAAEGRREKISIERQNLGFAVHVDNSKSARSALDALNKESIALAGELESLTGALEVATQKLESAKAQAAAAEDRAKAGKLRAVLECAAARAVEVDAILSSAAAELGELFKDIREFHALGEQFPTDEQMAVNARLAIKTFLMQLPIYVAKDFEFLAPNQRRTFTSIFQHMIGPIEQRIKQRLLAETETSREAA